MSEKTDEEIAAEVQNGNADSFGTLVERYESKIGRYAAKFLFDRDDAKDLVQETFIKAYTNIQSFDTKLRFSPWIYRVAHNEFINALKKKSRAMSIALDPDLIFPHPVARETADSAISLLELKRTLDINLDKLTPKYREPLVLYYFEEMDYKEIAGVLQIPVATVGVRLKRGRGILKEMVKNIV